ncbi:MAG: nucleotidyltransferase [Candidatus Roizmanbacteria bacterium]|nr:MAG: nucleotidyltransferase [Candidatus Roizmanbacteria bacterium]
MDKKTLIAQTEEFYKSVLKSINRKKIPFMMGGTYALHHYTGINRETKDMDIFCKGGDYPFLLRSLRDDGYRIRILDDRWLAKILSNGHYIDIIFGSITNLHPVDDTWLKHATDGRLFGIKIKFISPEDLIWSKAYRQERFKYDGADVNHLILKRGKELNWKHIFLRFEQHWEILFSHILNFRFVYPSERNKVPKWLIKELISRVENQLEVPTPQGIVCRGTLLSHYSYESDITEWGYKSVT